MYRFQNAHSSHNSFQLKWCLFSISWLAGGKFYFYCHPGQRSVSWKPQWRVLGCCRGSLAIPLLHPSFPMVFCHSLLWSGGGCAAEAEHSILLCKYYYTHIIIHTSPEDLHPRVQRGVYSSSKALAPSRLYVPSVGSSKHRITEYPESGHRCAANKWKISFATIFTHAVCLHRGSGRPHDRFKLPSTNRLAGQAHLEID